MGEAKNAGRDGHVNRASKIPTSVNELCAVAPYYCILLLKQEDIIKRSGGEIKLLLVCW
jgi:hypothetical protein